MSSETIFLTSQGTSVTFDVFLVGNAQGTSPGNPVTGLTYQSVSAYTRTMPTGTSTQIPLVTQTVAGAYSSGGFKEIDSTGQPGMYRFDLPNSLVPTSGEVSVVIAGTATAVGVATHRVRVVSTRQFWLGILTDGVAAVNTMATPEQALNALIDRSVPTNRSVTGTIETVLANNGTATAMTFTLNNSVNPTQVTRTT